MFPEGSVFSHGRWGLVCLKQGVLIHAHLWVDYTTALYDIMCVVFSAAIFFSAIILPFAAVFLQFYISAPLRDLGSLIALSYFTFGVHLLARNPPHPWKLHALYSIYPNKGQFTQNRFQSCRHAKLLHTHSTRGKWKQKNHGLPTGCWSFLWLRRDPSTVVIVKTKYF